MACPGSVLCTSTITTWFATNSCRPSSGPPVVSPLMAATVVNRQRGVAVSPSRLAQAAARALAAVGRPVSDLDILVVDDAEMRRMNRRFLGVDASTDVLAFPLEVPRAGGDLLGQV